jgi:glycosyltransferase involved in cell wall biosynthesis
MKTSKEEPLVSVIVTTYNRKELLKETIDSILNQTVRKFELIVVDNFSDYDFLSHIESFNDKRISPFQNINNGIIAVNRNFGIRRAKGKYIAFCDDDDLWLPNKLEVQLKHFDDDIIGVGSSATNIGDLTFHRCRKKIDHDYILDFNELLRGKTAPLSSLVIHNENLLFDENEGLKFVEDFEFQLRMTRETNKKIKVISEPLIFYRIHAENESADIKKAENIFNVYNKYKELMSEKQIAKCYYKSYFGLGIKSLRSGNQKVKDYFVQAFQYADIRRKCLLFLVVVFSKFPRILRDRMLFMYYKFRNL